MKRKRLSLAARSALLLLAALLVPHSGEIAWASRYVNRSASVSSGPASSPGPTIQPLPEISVAKPDVDALSALTSQVEKTRARLASCTQREFLSQPVADAVQAPSACGSGSMGQSAALKSGQQDPKGAAEPPRASGTGVLDPVNAGTLQSLQSIPGGGGDLAASKKFFDAIYDEAIVLIARKMANDRFMLGMPWDVDAIQSKLCKEGGCSNELVQRLRTETASDLALLKKLHPDRSPAQVLAKLNGQVKAMNDELGKVRIPTSFQKATTEPAKVIEQEAKEEHRDAMAKYTELFTDFADGELGMLSSSESFQKAHAQRALSDLQSIERKPLPMKPAVALGDPSLREGLKETNSKEEELRPYLHPAVRQEDLTHAASDLEKLWDQAVGELQRQKKKVGENLPQATGAGGMVNWKIPAAESLKDFVVAYGEAVGGVVLDDPRYEDLTCDALRSLDQDELQHSYNRLSSNGAGVGLTLMGMRLGSLGKQAKALGNVAQGAKYASTATKASVGGWILSIVTAGYEHRIAKEAERRKNMIQASIASGTIDKADGLASIQALQKDEERAKKARNMSLLMTGVSAGATAYSKAGAVGGQIVSSSVRNYGLAGRRVPAIVKLTTEDLVLDRALKTWKNNTGMLPSFVYLGEVETLNGRRDRYLFTVTDPQTGEKEVQQVDVKPGAGGPASTPSPVRR